MITCPKCKAEVLDKDFRVEVFDREVEVSLLCPNCTEETVLGFSQQDLDEP